MNERRLTHSRICSRIGRPAAIAEPRRPAGRRSRTRTRRRTTPAAPGRGKGCRRRATRRSCGRRRRCRTPGARAGPCRRRAASRRARRRGAASPRSRLGPVVAAARVEHAGGLVVARVVDDARVVVQQVRHLRDLAPGRVDETRVGLGARVVDPLQREVLEHEHAGVVGGVVAVRRLDVRVHADRVAVRVERACACRGRRSCGRPRRSAATGCSSRPSRTPAGRSPRGAGHARRRRSRCGRCAGRTRPAPVERVAVRRRQRGPQLVHGRATRRRRRPAPTARGRCRRARSPRRRVRTRAARIASTCARSPATSMSRSVSMSSSVWLVEHRRHLHRVLRPSGVTNSASSDASPVRSSVTGPTMPAVVIDWPHSGVHTHGSSPSTSGPTMRPGRPPGRLSWYFSVPLMTRLRWAKNSADGSSGSSGSCTATRSVVVLRQPVGHVEAERREGALVVPEVLAVQPHVGEVVDGREAEPDACGETRAARRAAGRRTCAGTRPARTGATAPRRSRSSRARPPCATTRRSAARAQRAPRRRERRVTIDVRPPFPATRVRHFDTAAAHGRVARCDG